MARALGRGRYLHGTYPEGPLGGGGGGAAVVPLTRQRFIDGGTTQAGLTGSAAEPFKTIAQFMASRTSVSVADVETNYVGWVMPAIGGYAGGATFPPYAITELRADSVGIPPAGADVGTVTWNNVAGAHTGGSAFIALHNVSATTGITITDDAGAPPSLLILSSDEFPLEGIVVGGITCNTTTKLTNIIAQNVGFSGGINAGADSASRAQVTCVSCQMLAGTVTASGMNLRDCIVDLTAATTFGLMEFTNCIFGVAMTITSTASPANFDGPSWKSFIEAGGTRAPAGDAGTAVLVVGGYNGGAVEGAALTAASTNVSLNGATSDAGWKGSNSGNHYTTSNGTPTTVTLKTGGGEKKGDTILITKTDLGANVVAVKNNAAATIGTIPTNNRGFVLAQFDGSDWVFVEGGALAA